MWKVKLLPAVWLTKCYNENFLLHPFNDSINILCTLCSSPQIDTVPLLLFHLLLASLAPSLYHHHQPIWNKKKIAWCSQWCFWDLQTGSCTSCLLTRVIEQQEKWRVMDSIWGICHLNHPFNLLLSLALPNVIWRVEAHKHLLLVTFIESFWGPTPSFLISCLLPLKVAAF